MRYTNRILALALVFGQLSLGTAFGQEPLSSSVLGNGGTNGANAQFSLSGTLGQGAPGVVSSASYLSEGGFWYTTADPDVEVSIPDLTSFYGQQITVPVEVTDTAASNIVSAEIFIDYDGS
jgi:hypothetical protein